jgi:glucose/mannose-6-phosphate isomerase
MTNLNSRDVIKKLDSKNMLGSIEKLAGQVKEIFKSMKNFQLPASYKKIDRVVALGMGGSALGAHFVRSVFAASLKVPMGIVNGYEAPASVGKTALVIASSYSGNTEEVLAAVKDAKKRGAKIVCISVGGELEKFSVKNNLPFVKIIAKNNPCGSPRMGLGYSIVGTALILARAGLIKFGEAEMKLILSAINKAQKKFGVAARNNAMKKLAMNADKRSVWFVGSGILGANAHIAANQTNENAKRFAGFYYIPEMNHHLLEGMMNPASNRMNTFFVLLESALYDKRVQKRYAITKNVLAKNKIKYASVVFEGKTALEQAFQALISFSYFSFYSAMVDGIDPTAIPFVDFFKRALRK